jgi:hypothetical protein
LSADLACHSAAPPLRLMRAYVFTDRHDSIFENARLEPFLDQVEDARVGDGASRCAIGRKSDVDHSIGESKCRGSFVKNEGGMRGVGRGRVSGSSAMIAPACTGNGTT